MVASVSAYTLSALVPKRSALTEKVARRELTHEYSTDRSWAPSNSEHCPVGGPERSWVLIPPAVPRPGGPAQEKGDTQAGLSRQLNVAAAVAFFAATVTLYVVAAFGAAAAVLVPVTVPPLPTERPAGRPATAARRAPALAGLAG